MAFGLSPKHIQEYRFENLDQENSLVLAIEAALKLDWNVSFTSESGFVAYTKFSLSSWSEEVTIKIENGTAIIKSECTGSQLVDWGKNKSNVEDLTSAIAEVKNSLSQEELETKYLEIQQNFSSGDDDILNKPPLTAKEKITDFFAIFKPTEGYFISPILIDINLFIFIAMLISGVHVLMPENQSLLDWGANFRPLTLEGQWWRLLTACFLHIGILHLLLNMYALLYIGLLLEPYLGRSRFIAAYLISGIAASMTSLWWHDLTISAGASGAIFGMYGVFLSLLTSNLLDKSVKKALLTSIVVFVSYNILNGLQPNSGIDNAAHIGGLLSGIIIGYAFIPSLKRFENTGIKFSTIGSLTALLLFSSFMVYRTLPNDIGQYEKEMERFASMESMALEVYNLPDGTPDSEILFQVKDRGLYYWNENLKLLDGLKSLDLPLSIRARNSKLMEYCELRIKSYELIYRAIKEDTDLNQSEINEYNQRIEEIITELAGNQ